jgi:hypothetical protein
VDSYVNTSYSEKHIHPSSWLNMAEFQTKIKLRVTVRPCFVLQELRNSHLYDYMCDFQYKTKNFRLNYSFQFYETGFTQVVSYAYSPHYPDKSQRIKELFPPWHATILTSLRIPDSGLIILECYYRIRFVKLVLNFFVGLPNYLPT